MRAPSWLVGDNPYPYEADPDEPADARAVAVVVIATLVFWVMVVGVVAYALSGGFDA